MSKTPGTRRARSRALDRVQKGYPDILAAFPRAQFFLRRRGGAEPGGQGGEHDRVAAQACEAGPRAQRMRGRLRVAPQGPAGVGGQVERGPHDLCGRPATMVGMTKNTAAKTDRPAAVLRSRAPRPGR